MSVKRRKKCVCWKELKGQFGCLLLIRRQMTAKWNEGVRGHLALGNYYLFLLNNGEQAVFFIILVNKLTANIIVCKTAYYFYFCFIFFCCTTSHSFVKFRFLAGGSVFCCQSLEKRSHKSLVCLCKATLYLLTNREMFLQSFSQLIHVCSLLLEAIFVFLLHFVIKWKWFQKHKKQVYACMVIFYCSLQL